MLVVHWVRHGVAGLLDPPTTELFNLVVRAVERRAIAPAAPWPDDAATQLLDSVPGGTQLRSAVWGLTSAGSYSDGSDPYRFGRAVSIALDAAPRTSAGGWSKTSAGVTRSANRAVSPRRSWLAKLPDFRTAAVVGLAESLWRTLDPHVAAVLADALEEAGLPAELVTPYRAEPGSLTRADWLFWHLGASG